MSSISVILPNYNGVNLLKENLPYLIEALRFTEISSSEIIIADDASTDDSVVFLEQNYPEIILVKNKVNGGFATNVNSGLRRASKKLVFILNTDVKLEKSYFAGLLDVFQKDDTFGVMGRIMSADGKKNQDAAKYPTLKLGRIAIGQNYIHKNRHEIYTFFLSGANALIDREKLLELGGFNEFFSPYYYEDVDLGFRAWLNGYKLYYNHNAVCFHASSATTKNVPKNKREVIVKRNYLFLHYLHLEGFELVVFFVKIFFKTISKLIFFDKNFIKTIKLFLRDFKKLRKEKRIFRNNLRYKKQGLKNIKSIKKIIEKDVDKSEIIIFSKPISEPNFD